MKKRKRERKRKMQLKMTFKQFNDDVRKAMDKYMKRKSKERDNIAVSTLKDKLKDSLAYNLASIQGAIEIDDISKIKTNLACLYVQTLCANHICHDYDFDAIVENARKNTNYMRGFIMSLDKREHIKSIAKLLADIDDNGLNERNIALIIITIYMINIQYDIDFGERIADINIEDIL